MPSNGTTTTVAPSSGVTITVCVPVYNVERYLCECLDSIFSQNYADFDVVLVDDGSTDSSGAFAMNMPRAIRSRPSFSIRTTRACCSRAATALRLQQATTLCAWIPTMRLSPGPSL